MNDVSCPSISSSVCVGAKWSCSRLTFDNQLPPTVQPLCPENSVLTDCVTQCPVTCDNLNEPDSGTCTSDPALCQSGCQCVDGFVKQGDQCVNRTACPCHHGGHDYHEGDVIAMDCNQWSVDGGGCCYYCHRRHPWMLLFFLVTFTFTLSSL